MSSIASYPLTTEEREELKIDVSMDIQTILGLAALIEKSLDSIHRLDDINLGDVDSLSLKLANLSRYSYNAQNKLADFMAYIEKEWNEVQNSTSEES
jgi:hypothetical protein